MNANEPTGPVEPSQLYKELMMMNNEAFIDGQYDVAYHILMAALHLARHAHDQPGMATIAARASYQMEWIDEADPTYRHSTASANSRGNRSIYSVLVQQAQTWERMEEQR